MKKYKILGLLILTLALFSSCEENENKIWNRSQSLVDFNTNSASLPVTISGTGSVEIQFDCTASSSEDRTFQVKLNEDLTTANSENFSFDTTVTIPANAYNATLVVNGVDTEGLTTDPKKIVIDIVDNDSLLIGSESLEISIYMVCPVEATKFTGNYLMEQVSAEIDGPTLSDGAVVAISSVDATTRSFVTQTYPDYCGSFNKTFIFNLVCNTIVVPTQDTTCSCGDPVGWFTAAETPESYDANDDSEFLITFTDDAKTNCGAPAQTTYKFTKQ